MNPFREVAIGIDIGGTFTDFVIFDPGHSQLETFKILSTPDNPAEAVLTGLQRIFGDRSDKHLLKFNLIHGSTVATNALLERKGARTALVATQGFSDIIQIGRQNRPELYDLLANPLPTLVPPELRFEVSERVDSQGNILQSINPKQLVGLVASLKSEQVESVAVCLLFSFLNSTHELAIAEVLRAAGFSVSASCEILPEFREYERLSTTAVNAYVSPVLEHYLSYLQEMLVPGSHLRVMQSNGGAIQAEAASRNGVNCILSGPAGGVIGCHHIASLVDGKTWDENGGNGLKVITFDMGGTSTDVSLIDEKPQITSDSVISGCPIRIPMLDIHTIGAGGGSIARIDAGGALRVGPESAGADPGPACYGIGFLPTVTDANLVLGRLAAEFFLDGRMPLDKSRAYSAVDKLALELNLNPQQAALGIVQVVNAHMMRALRVISVERGYDPRDFTLLSFGGAGGLHAVDLARGLGIPRVLVPPIASTLSAFGMLVADVVKDYSLTVMQPGDTPLSDIENQLASLVAKGRREVMAEGISEHSLAFEYSADLRYGGQSYELNIPFSPKLLDDFHTSHRQLYGYARPAAPVEIVNLRVRVIGQVKPPQLTTRIPVGTDASVACLGKRRVTLDRGEMEIPFYRWESLTPGNLLPGPAVVVSKDTTILLGTQDQAKVDAYTNLVISVGRT